MSSPATPPAARAAAARVARAAARRYVAGPELADALRVAAGLRERSMAAVLGYWDDDRRETPAEVALAYRAAIDAAAGPAPAEVAVKLPALGHDAGLLAAVAAHAAARRVALHCDALAIEAADPTLAFAEATGAGVTLPGRWARSVADAGRAARLGLRVRVVKGQWEDPADAGRDPAAGFLEVVERLAGGRSPVLVATHDGALAATALRRLGAAGTPCELQLLYGLPAQASLAAARDLGVPVRAYVPYGSAYLPYALSALRGHPALAARLARDLVLRRSAWSLAA